MGPTDIKDGHYMDVDQHPHIGLSTLTYMLEGEIMHRDSIGTHQRISPGSINLMVAGKGVTHTERTPKDLRGNGVFTAHGYQIWIALPKDFEDIEPEFHHFEAKDLPTWQNEGAQFQLIAGKGYDYTSPVPVHSELFMLDIKTEHRYELHIKGELNGEIGICIVKGAIEACENHITEGNMLVSKTDDSCSIVLLSETHIILFGGEPFEEERYIYWNFVSTSKEKIEAAKIRWQQHDFPKVPYDDSYVPLPKA